MLSTVYINQTDVKLQMAAYSYSDCKVCARSLKVLKLSFLKNIFMTCRLFFAYYFAKRKSIIKLGSWVTFRVVKVTQHWIWRRVSFFVLLCCQETACEVFDEHVSSRRETLEHCLFGRKMKCSSRKSSWGEKKITVFSSKMRQCSGLIGLSWSVEGWSRVVIHGEEMKPSESTITPGDLEWSVYITITQM